MEVRIGDNRGHVGGRGGSKNSSPEVGCKRHQRGAVTGWSVRARQLGSARVKGARYWVCVRVCADKPIGKEANDKGRGHIRGGRPLGRWGAWDLHHGQRAGMQRWELRGPLWGLHPLRRDLIKRWVPLGSGAAKAQVGRSSCAEWQAAFSREQGLRVAVSPRLKSGPQSNQSACSCNFLSTVQRAGCRLRGSGQQGHTARASPVSTVSSPVRGLVGSRQGLGVLWLGKGVRQGPLVKLGNCWPPVNELEGLEVEVSE